jgi:hypothetical protein
VPPSRDRAAPVANSDQAVACEKFHDIVDEVVVNDELGERRFAGPIANDTVMTTWHEHETLEQALDFFVTSAVPTQGFEDLRSIAAFEW